QDLVGAEITIRATGLQLPHRGRVKVQLAVDTENILANGLRSHAVSVMRDTTELGALPGEERLPPRCASSLRMLSSPIHQVGSVLIGTHEEDLILSMKIYNRILDAGA